ncbi:UDP-glucuronosyl/UDP-glucosyltransferase [Sesbania bispinosa]|nr:UDP-glucuronosyl/UDP-glucosyltransferase [Sesbania bispinosa]
MDASPLHIAMFPWFAMGHLTPWLHLSNKLAKRDVPFSLYTLIATAMDRTEKDIELLLINPASTAYFGTRPKQSQGREPTEVELMEPPPGFPGSSIKLYAHELRSFVATSKLEFGSGVLLYDRFGTGTRLADAMGFKGCKEIEGPYTDYLEIAYGKPVLLSGPLLPEPSISTLEEKWVAWLGGFKAGSVIYCAYGSESPLPQNQFQELLLGLELRGFPFLAALKPPVGFESIEEALPQGFRERVQGRGIAYGGWVQQQLILEHPSVGCFITHCGAASITEALVNTCQLVLLPRLGTDHIITARMMSTKLKVGVEVEKGEEDDLFRKESVCKAVKIVMDEENELGREVRVNHTKVRDLLLSNNLESSCLDTFCQKLQGLL